MSVPQNRLVPVAKPGIEILKPIREIMRQAERGELTFQQLTDFAEHRNPFAKQRFASLEAAIGLLGKKKVVTYAQSWRAWTGEDTLSNGSPGLNYFEKTLVACARSNRNGVSDWRLIWIQPWDIERQILENPGIGTNRTTSAYHNKDQWTAFSKGRWSLGERPITPTHGYYLIDFKGRWGELSHEGQNKRLKLAGNLVRTNESILAQALVSLAIVHDQYPFHRTKHWGSMPSITDRGVGHVVIGPFDRDGMMIGHAAEEDPGENTLQISVTRRFDTEPE